ncbi:Transposase IS4 [Popillia japonica]|uniref:Transposase IS4 n=1 Tax=Popillia japonica TaxID=7064 RepID=A0AAW1HWS8_POPJA
MMAVSLRGKYQKDRGKKSVAMISTMHDPLEITQLPRSQKDGSRPMVSCPSAVKDYNQFMGRVDHFDQLHSAYNISWKSRRWWMRIFYYCLEACIVNSFVIYKANMKMKEPQRKALTHLQFRSLLASGLIGTFSSRIRRGPASQIGRARKQNHPDGRQTLQNALRLTNVGEHLPIKGTHRRCPHCSTQKTQQRSIIQCQKCNIALCRECFVPFHTS